MYDNFYAVILAGGGGTRLWPMSRKSSPKQLLPLIDDRTLFKMSVERLAPLFPLERVFVVTGPDYVDKMRQETPEIPVENYIIEPYGRDSAPATALAIAVIHKRDPDAVIALLASDHFIEKEKSFIDILKNAYDFAQNEYIVTLGIAPSFPATGFGYIRQGDLIEKHNGYECYSSLGFTEKPDVVLATEFLASGQYSWNSGMFIWKTERAIAEFERQQPEIYSLLEELNPTIDSPGFHATLLSVWEKMPKTSIDFGIMENAEKMAVIPIEIGWNDVGSWGSLYDVVKRDKFGNAFRGEGADHVVLDTKDTLVFSNRMAVTIGIDDIIIVDTDDVILVCHKDRSQEVKAVVNHLKATKKLEYL